MSPRDTNEYQHLMGEIHARQLHGELGEQLLTAVYGQWLRPGDTAVDGGGGHGRHSIGLTMSVGHAGAVIAYEPVEENRRLMLKSFGTHLAPRGLDHVVRLRSSALSDASGVAEFAEVVGAGGYSSLKLEGAPPIGDVVMREVQCVRLDEDLTSDDIAGTRFIKLDLEGGDFPAMRGAENVLRRARPVVGFEFSPEANARCFGYTRGEFFAFFKSIAFELYCYLLLPFVDDDWLRPHQTMPLNFFAVPSESSAAFVSGSSAAVARCLAENGLSSAALTVRGAHS